MYMRIHHGREIIASTWRISGIITDPGFYVATEISPRRHKNPQLSMNSKKIYLRRLLCLISASPHQLGDQRPCCMVGACRLLEHPKLLFSVFLSIDKEAGENTEQKLWI